MYRGPGKRQPPAGCAEARHRILRQARGQVYRLPDGTVGSLCASGCVARSWSEAAIADPYHHPGGPGRKGPTSDLASSCQVSWMLSKRRHNAETAQDGVPRPSRRCYRRTSYGQGKTGAHAGRWVSARLAIGTDNRAYRFVVATKISAAGAGALVRHGPVGEVQRLTKRMAVPYAFPYGGQRDLRCHASCKQCTSTIRLGSSISRRTILTNSSA